MDEKNEENKTTREEEVNMNKVGYTGYIIPSTTPWATRKKLKRTPPSEDVIERTKYIDSHNFDIEFKNGKILVKITEK